MIITGTEVIRLSSAELVEAFGKTVTYNDIVAVLDRYSLLERMQIEEGVYKKQKEFWDATVDYYQQWHPQLPPVSEHFKRLLRSIEPQEGEVMVDLGCGLGALISCLLEKGLNLRIIGIDYAPQMLARCREKLSVYTDSQLCLIEGDFLQGLSFLKNESVDKVVSNWGISYASKKTLNEIFSEVYRVLEPKGVFICVAMIDTGPKLATLEKFLSPWQAFQKRRAISQAKRFQKDLAKFFPVYTIEEWREMFEQYSFSFSIQFFSIYGTSVTLMGRKV